MKKAITLLVLVIFLFSLMSFGILAKREEGKSGVATGTEDGNDSKEASGTNLIDTSGAEQATTNVKVKGVSEFAKGVRERSEKFREKMKAATSSDERKEIVKEKREEIRVGFEAAKELFKTSKKELKDCKSTYNLRCNEVRQKYKQNAVTFMLGSVDTLIGYLEKVKESISASSQLENKETLIAKVDARITKLEELKKEVEALGENPSREKLNNIAKKLKDELKEVNTQGKKAANYVLASRMGGVLVKAERLEAKLGKTLAKLSDKGYDVTVAKNKVDEFKGHVEDSRDLYDQAKIKLKAGASPSEVHELIKGSHRHLKLAHVALKDAVKEIKAIKGGEDALEKAETETPKAGQEEIIAVVEETVTNTGTAIGANTAPQDIKSSEATATDTAVGSVVV